MMDERHSVAMKSENLERFCISPPVLKITTNSVFGKTRNDVKSETESFSQIAQKMVDEQLSICKSFKSKIEQSLQELHDQWDRKTVSKNEDHLTRGQDQGSKQCEASLSPQRMDGRCSQVSYPMPTDNGYPSPRHLDGTRTSIHKPRTMSDSVAYDGWESSPKPQLHCSNPPYRVPARKVTSLSSHDTHSQIPPLTRDVQITDANKTPAFIHAIKLEDIRDSQKSAFTSYAIASTSPPFHVTSPRETSHMSCLTIATDARGSEETVLRIKTEPASHYDLNVKMPDGCVDQRYGGKEPTVQCSRVDSSDTVSRLLRLTQVANEHLSVAVNGTKPQKRRTKGKGNDCLHLWEFLRDLLNKDDQQVHCIEWTCREKGEFRLIKTAVVAKLWGKSKNRHQMTYEKMARAMRYYYKMNILEKVPNKRLHFRFGVHMLPKVICE